MASVVGEFAISTTSAVQPVGSSASLGTALSVLAPADHVHQGIDQFQVSGNTSGATGTGRGTLVIAAGRNVLISAQTAPGAMTLNISGLQQSSSSFLLGGFPRATNSSFPGSYSAVNIQLMPFTCPYYVPVSKVEPLCFGASFATSTVTRSRQATLSVAILSLNSSASSYIQMGLASLSLSVSMDTGNPSSSGFYTGIRSTTVSFNSSFAFIPGQTYAIAWLGSTTSSGFTIAPMASRNNDQQLLLANPNPWGSSITSGVSVGPIYSGYAGDVSSSVGLNSIPLSRVTSAGSSPQIIIGFGA